MISSYRILGFLDFPSFSLPSGLLIGHQKSHPQVIPVAVPHHLRHHLLYPLPDDDDNDDVIVDLKYIMLT